jgi:ribonuclease HI
MNDSATLTHIAFKTERAAARRLARQQDLSEAEALRRTLERSAGHAGLDALVAARLAAHAADAARLDARITARAAAAARQTAHHDDKAGAWRAWFDGSARPNPGRCTIGVLLRGPDDLRIELAQPAGDGDSSDAEYRALIALLETARAHRAAGLTVYGDSRVVIDDVNGPALYGAPALAPYRARVHALLAELPGARLRWVPRHKNREADALSQRAFSTPSSTTPSFTADVPDLIDIP